jgi:polyferredoxin
MGVWTIVGLAMVYALLSRDRLEVNVLHDRNPQFVTLSDGSIRNGYTIKLLNMIPEPRVIFLSMDGLPGATMSVNEIDQPPGRSFAIPVDPDKLRTLKVYVSQPERDIASDRQEFQFIAEDKASTERDVYQATFNAPE